MHRNSEKHKKPVREQREAAALRENLRKRKEQERARAGAGVDQTRPSTTGCSVKPTGCG